MKKYFSHSQVFTFLIILIFGTSCNGQVKKDLPKETVSESNIIADGQPKLTATQSLPKYGNVHCSLQDKAGNLWFGTTGNGVYKYDGKSFTQFTAKNGLNSNELYCILEDKDGKIWIGTAAGLVFYDGKTFTEIQIPLRKNMTPNKLRNEHTVFSIMQAKSGKLWFATIDGVYIYDGKSFTPFIVNEGAGFLSSNNNVEYILEDKAGNIWFGGRVNKGVFRYDGKSITNLKPNGDNFAWPVLQDKNGNIWFSNWSGAYRYDGKSFTKIDGLSTSPINRIIEDKKGNLWFGGGNRGICRYDGKTFTWFTTKDGLINNDVWSILEDRAGNIWVGTRNTSLFRYDGKTFTPFTTNDEPTNNSILPNFLR
jgi:ligand-binding sensor domain-containing protein